MLIFLLCLSCKFLSAHRERDISQAADCSSKQKCGRRQAMNPLIQIAIQILKFQQTPSGLSLSLSSSGFSAYAWISYVKADGWFMAYQPYTIRTSSKNEKKAKKAEKRKTAAVRNSAINMQIK